MSGSLAGKRALVTGAARGIGQAIAEALARAGARVILADRLPATETGARIRTAAGASVDLPADVADEQAVLRLFHEIDRRMGGLDILVNNAGILIEKPLLETTAADFDRLMAVNLRGVFLVGREALRR